MDAKMLWLLSVSYSKIGDALNHLHSFTLYEVRLQYPIEHLQLPYDRYYCCALTNMKSSLVKAKELA